MKTRIFNLLCILFALPLLASCIYIGAGVGVVGHSEESGQYAKQATAGVSLDETGLNAGSGTSNTTEKDGTLYKMSSTDVNSQAHAMVKDQLLLYRDMEGVNEQWEQLLEYNRQYNRILSQEIDDLQNDIPDLENDRYRARITLDQARAKQDILMQHKADIESILKLGTIAEFQKKTLQNDLVQLDKEDQRIGMIINQLQGILESDKVIIGGS